MLVRCITWKSAGCPLAIFLSDYNITNILVHGVIKHIWRCKWVIKQRHDVQITSNDFISSKKMLDNPVHSKCLTKKVWQGKSTFDITVDVFGSQVQMYLLDPGLVSQVLFAHHAHLECLRWAPMRALLTNDTIGFQLNTNTNRLIPELS